MIMVTEDTLIRFGDVVTEINNHIKKLEIESDRSDSESRILFIQSLIAEDKRVREIVFKAFQDYGIEKGGKK